ARAGGRGGGGGASKGPVDRVVVRPGRGADRYMGQRPPGPGRLRPRSDARLRGQTTGTRVRTWPRYAAAGLSKVPPYRGGDSVVGFPIPASLRWVSSGRATRADEGPPAPGGPPAF